MKAPSAIDSPATLAITPLRRWTGSAWVMRLRRMIGLFAFFYGVVHFASYISFDHVFDAGAIIKDIMIYITVFATVIVPEPGRPWVKSEPQEIGLVPVLNVALCCSQSCTSQLPE